MEGKEAAAQEEKFSESFLVEARKIENFPTCRKEMVKHPLSTHKNCFKIFSLRRTEETFLLGYALLQDILLDCKCKTS